MRRTVLTVMAIAAACSDPLPSPSTVDVLRILALTTPTPELRPGDALDVRALWFDPIAGRDVVWRWRLCDPGVADDPRVCALPRGPIELSPGSIDRVSIPADRLALGPDGADRTWIVYAIACPGAAAVVLSEGRLGCASGGGSEAFRRVTVRSAGALNRDPAIAGWTLDLAGRSIALDDGAVTAIALGPCDGDCPSVSVTLTPADDAPETFAGGAESLLGSIYVSAGAVDPPRQVDDPGSSAAMRFSWTASRGVAGGGTIARVWAVLRDQRGGETARSVTISAR